MKARSPEARALLAEYRRGQGLQPAARERVARALERRLASGAPGLLLDAPPPQLPLDTIAPRALWGGKLAAVALGIGLASIALLWSSRGAPALPSRTAPVALRARAPAVSAPEEPRPRAVVAPLPVEQRVVPRSDARAPAPERKRKLAREHERPRDDAAPPATVVAELAATDPAREIAVPSLELELEPEGAPRESAQDEAVMIDEEVALLRSASAALRAANPKRALAQLAEHRWRFPHGQLADSREVARMLALCASGEAALARAEAQRFLAAQPRSPFAQRVRGICVEPER